MHITVDLEPLQRTFRNLLKFEIAGMLYTIDCICAILKLVETEHKWYTEELHEIPWYFCVC